MLRFLVLAIIVPGNITKRGTGLVGGLGWKDESGRGLESYNSTRMWLCFL
jgi:hypothetical protein